MIDLRPVTRDDIRHVVFRMWKRGADEAKRHGYEDNERIIHDLSMRANEYGFAFYHNNEPVAVFGAYAGHDDCYHTWFVATDKFTVIGKQATVFLKRFIKEKTMERPGASLELWSSVDHPEADRWFQLLGFQPLEPYDIYNRYVYVRKSG